MNELSLYEDVGYTLKKLLLDDPYYGMFMMTLDKQISTDIPTMAVGLNGVNIKLLINPNFWFSMSLEHKKGVCKHEMLHLCYMHLLTSDRYPDRIKDNIATDAEINQYIKPEYLPEFAVSLQSIEQQFGIKLKPKEGRDVYYKALEGKIPPEYSCGNSEHFWDIVEGLSDAQKAVVQNQIDYLMEHIAEEITKRNGTVPGEIQGLIQARKIPPRFDWKKHLRRFVGASKEVYTKPTRYKPNPYFPGNPSNKIKLKQNILCIIDTSGSVSNLELEEFMSEIYNIWRMGDVVTILCVDTKIYDPYEYKGQLEVQIHGRGGTYFTPSLEYFNSHPEYSCGIYFTDGEAELPPNANKPFLWVISSRGTTRYIDNHNGKKLKIEA